MAIDDALEEQDKQFLSQLVDAAHEDLTMLFALVLSSLQGNSGHTLKNPAAVGHELYKAACRIPEEKRRRMIILDMPSHNEQCTLEDWKQQWEVEHKEIGPSKSSYLTRLIWYKENRPKDYSRMF